MMDISKSERKWSWEGRGEDNGVRKKLRKEMWRDQEGDVVEVDTITSLLEVGLHRQLRMSK